MSDQQRNDELRSTSRTSEDLPHVGAVHYEAKCNDTGPDGMDHDMSVAHGDADASRSDGQAKHCPISSADFVLPETVDSAESAEQDSNNSPSKDWSTAMAKSDKQ